MEIKDSYSRKEIENFLYAAVTLSTEIRVVRDLIHAYPHKDVVENVRNKIAPFKEKEYLQFKTISNLLENIEKELSILEKKILEVGE